MTPQESREQYLSSVFTPEEEMHLKETGLAQDYIEGEISINDIYKIFRDQGI